MSREWFDRPLPKMPSREDIDRRTDEIYDRGIQPEIDAGHAESKLEAAKRKYGRPFGTNGKTTKGIAFWTAERVSELAQANQALRAERERK